MDHIPPEEREQMIGDIDSEIRELSGLVTELVDLAAAPPMTTEATEEVGLADIAERVAGRYRRRTESAINVKADDSVVLGRAVALERAVGNLVDNAVKWSPPGAPIDVIVADGSVTVADQGPGIDDEDRPLVFDRFYRATKARSTPGSGLGLSIVAKVVADHGGETFVADSETGAVVGFRLPTVDVPSDSDFSPVNGETA
jgi:two-component system sensor histidine kinase MprB